MSAYDVFPAQLGLVGVTDEDVRTYLAQVLARRLAMGGFLRLPKPRKDSSMSSRGVTIPRGKARGVLGVVGPDEEVLLAGGEYRT
ncbi:hypothetical protein GCM10027203_59060 [Nonomuraea fastidiosa]